MNIYVSNLSFAIQDEDLRGLFTPFGEVATARIINDKVTGQPRGFGFVEMREEGAARKAIRELHEAEVDGRHIKVVEARPKEGSSSRDGVRGEYRKNRW